jgi:organic radical activating enzyme
MDYYCSTKFTDLQVHVQGRLLYNCCRAYPERVDLDWLEANPGKLFHTDTMVNDRELMLKNKSCHSCDHGCYKYEKQGFTSVRQLNGQSDHISDVQAPMLNLAIMLSTDCSLSCAYCSPEFSTGWQREISTGGSYKVGGHIIENSNWSELWSKMKQRNRATDSRFFKLLLREIDLADGLRDVGLLGGEPLLNNSLFEIIDHVRHKNVSINTGLGVSEARLEKVLDDVEGMDVVFRVSAESTGKNFEFLRHGLAWADFDRRIQLIKERGAKLEFVSTISNISVIDFHNFVDYAGNTRIRLNTVNTPAFMSPHVLDASSKHDCIKTTNSMGGHAEEISKMLTPNVKDTDRHDIGDYLKQLRSRRKIGLDFLPPLFLQWCGLKS